MVCIDGAIPPIGGIVLKHIAMGVSWFHSFLLRVLQNLLTKNEEGSHLLWVLQREKNDEPSSTHPNHIYSGHQFDCCYSFHPHIYLSIMMQEMKSLTHLFHAIRCN